MTRSAIRFLCASFLVLILGPQLSAQKITVKSATPSWTTQGTTLNVTVSGSGFAMGAEADFLVTGTTSTGNVIVHETIFKSSSELSVNLTALEDAVVSSYDILVTNTNGRTGKGIEKFAVKSSPGTLPPDSTEVPVSVSLDSRSIQGGSFTDGQNGVSALIKNGELVVNTGTQEITFCWNWPPSEAPDENSICTDWTSAAGVWISTEQSGMGDPAGTSVIRFEDLSAPAVGQEPVEGLNTVCVQLGYTWKPSKRAENRLVFHRWWENGTADAEPRDETSKALITCMGDNGTMCTAWTIEPKGCVGPDGVGALYDTTNTRNPVRLDLYDMPHTITVTVKQAP